MMHRYRRLRPLFVSRCLIVRHLSSLPHILRSLVDSLSPALRTPNAIQSAAATPILQHQSTLIQSPTGTGKTLAYLLPLITEIVNKRKMTTRLSRKTARTTPLPSPASIDALIVLPSSELVTQLDSLLTSLTATTAVRYRVIAPQTSADALRDDPPNILIGTPKHMTATLFPQLVRQRHRDADEETLRRQRHIQFAVRHGSNNNTAVAAADTRTSELAASDHDFDDGRKFESPLSTALTRLRWIVIDEIDLLLAPPSRYRHGRIRDARPLKPAVKLLCAVKAIANDCQLIGVSATINAPLRTLLHRAGWNQQHKPVVVRADTTKALTLPETIRHYYCSCPTPRQLRQGRYVVTVDEAANKDLTEKYSARPHIEDKYSALVALLRHFAVRTAALFIDDETSDETVIDTLDSYNVKATRWSDVARSVETYNQLVERLSQPSGDARDSTAAGSQTAAHIIVVNERAARGMDLPFLSWAFVLGQNSLRDSHRYLHIAGRVGRAGRTGNVVALLHPNEVGLLSPIINYCSVQMQPIDLKAVIDEQRKQDEAAAPPVTRIIMGAARQSTIEV